MWVVAHNQKYYPDCEYFDTYEQAKEYCDKVIKQLLPEGTVTLSISKVEELFILEGEELCDQPDMEG